MNTAQKSAAVLVWLAFSAQLSTYVVHHLNRVRRDPALSELSWLLRPRSEQWLQVDLTDEGGTGRESRVALPDSWLQDSHPPSPGSIFLFVDGQPVHYFYGDPEVLTGAPYGYFKGSLSRALIVRCPDSCRRADVVLHDVHLKWRVGWWRLRSSGPWLATILVGILSGGALAFWLAMKRPRSAPALALLMTAASVLWLWFALYGVSAASWLLGAELLLLSVGAFRSPRLLRRGRLLWDEADTTDRGWATAIALVVVAMVVALPYVLTGLSWIPGDADDSFLYLYGASRLLTTGSLVRGALNPSAWVYSGYPFVLALVARVFNTHPMIAYRYLGFLGAFLMPASMGAFAYAATRRPRAAILACVVGGLWGGLAGYVWLFSDAMPSLFQGRAPSLLMEDYYAPRFLAEYTGPHSALTAYLCRVPFYPRELGLVLFWPALGILYGGLPRLNNRRLVAFTLLGLLATAIYPHYGMPLFIVWGFVAVFAARRLVQSGPNRRSLLISVFPFFLALTLFFLADFFLRRYKGPTGLLNYLLSLWHSPLDTLPVNPSLRFRPFYLLSDHAFMLAAIAAGWILRRRGRGLGGSVLFGSQARGLFSLSLALTLVAGLLTLFHSRLKSFLDPYGWIILWRCLVEPLIVTSVALSLEGIFVSLRKSTRALYALPVLCVPMFSPLHWTINVELYHRGVREVQTWQLGRTLYDQYAEDGRRLLGKVRICEPLLAQEPGLNYLQAALGLSVLPPDHAEAWLARPVADLLEEKEKGGLGDLAVVRQDSLARLQYPGIESLGVVGRHRILHRRDVPCPSGGVNANGPK